MFYISLTNDASIKGINKNIHNVIKYIVDKNYLSIMRCLTDLCSNFLHIFLSNCLEPKQPIDLT